MISWSELIVVCVVLMAACHVSIRVWRSMLTSQRSGCGACKAGCSRGDTTVVILQLGETTSRFAGRQLDEG